MRVVICFFLLFYVTDVLSLNEAQMKSTIKLMRNTCQTKTKITDAEIEAMHTGTWDNNPTAKCYTHCFLKMMKLMKDGKFDLEYGKSQLHQLPPARLEPTKATFESCGPEVNSQTFEGKCDAAYAFAKCFYFHNPANYFLP